MVTTRVVALSAAWRTWPDLLLARPSRERPWLCENANARVRSRTFFSAAGIEQICMLLMRADRGVQRILFSSISRLACFHTAKTRCGSRLARFAVAHTERQGLERDDFSSKRHPALSFCLSMIFSENRLPLFRILLVLEAAGAHHIARRCSSRVAARGACTSAASIGRRAKDSD